MINTYADDPRRTNATNLSTTSVTTILQCATSEVKTVESILVSCGSVATDCTLSFNDGSTNFYILNGQEIAANDHLLLTGLNIILRPNQSIKAQASAVDKLSIIIVSIDALPKRDDGGVSGRR